MCLAHVQCLFEIGLCDWLEEGFVHESLAVGFKLQAGNPQLKTPNNNPSRCVVVLADHLCIILKAKNEFKERGWQELLRGISVFLRLRQHGKGHLVQLRQRLPCHQLCRSRWKHRGTNIGPWRSCERNR